MHALLCAVAFCVLAAVCLTAITAALCERRARVEHLAEHARKNGPPLLLLAALSCPAEAEEQSTLPAAHLQTQEVGGVGYDSFDGLLSVSATSQVWPPRGYVRFDLGGWAESKSAEFALVAPQDGMLRPGCFPLGHGDYRVRLLRVRAGDPPFYSQSRHYVLHIPEWDQIYFERFVQPRIEAQARARRRSLIPLECLRCEPFSPPLRW